MAGWTTADGLARLYAVLGEHVDEHDPLLGAELLAEVTRVRVSGDDLVLPARTAFACGFEVNADATPGAAPFWFGHGGLGGSGGSSIPSVGASFGFTTDHMPPGGGRDPGEAELRLTVLECLQASS